MNLAPMQQLEQVAQQWGIPLSEVQLAQFATYATELQAANAMLNLTTVTDLAGIVERHFLDSLRCALSWGDPPLRVADIGSGAGLPGLPLKILRPQIQLTLVESIQKKAAFLEAVSATLGLGDVLVCSTRAEVLGQDQQHREQYDLVLARAVAELRVLAEYCLPLVRVGGRFLAPKGAMIETELQAAQHAIAELGGQLITVEAVEIPQALPRTLVVVEKVRPTPPAYPRRAGLPAKRPLSLQT